MIKGGGQAWSTESREKGNNFAAAESRSSLSLQSRFLKGQVGTEWNWGAAAKKITNTSWTVPSYIFPIPPRLGFVLFWCAKVTWPPAGLTRPLQSQTSSTEMVYRVGFSPSATDMQHHPWSSLSLGDQTNATHKKVQCALIASALFRSGTDWQGR